MSDVMHVPILVHYGPESHAAAGALVALGVEYTLRGNVVHVASRPARLAVAIVAALAIGIAKEYLVDRHAHNREIAPWGVGAAAALGFVYSF